MAKDKNTAFDLLSLSLGIDIDDDSFKKAEDMLDSFGSKLGALSGKTITGKVSGFEGVIGAIQKLVVALDKLERVALEIESRRMGSAVLGITPAQKQQMSNILGNPKLEKLGLSADDIESDLSRITTIRAEQKLKGTAHTEAYIAAQEFGQHFGFSELQGSALDELFVGNGMTTDQVLSLLSSKYAEALRISEESGSAEDMEYISNFVKTLNLSKSFQGISELTAVSGSEFMTQLFDKVGLGGERLYEGSKEFATAVNNFKLALAREGNIESLQSIGHELGSDWSYVKLLTERAAQNRAEYSKQGGVLFPGILDTESSAVWGTLPGDRGELPTDPFGIKTVTDPKLRNKKYKDALTELNAQLKGEKVNDLDFVTSALDLGIYNMGAENDLERFDLLKYVVSKAVKPEYFQEHTLDDAVTMLNEAVGTTSFDFTEIVKRLPTEVITQMASELREYLSIKGLEGSERAHGIPDKHIETTTNLIIKDRTGKGVEAEVESSTSNVEDETQYLNFSN